VARGSAAPRCCWCAAASVAGLDCCCVCMLTGWVAAAV
jgi:hypothetical protein